MAKPSPTPSFFRALRLSTVTIGEYFPGGQGRCRRRRVAYAYHDLPAPGSQDTVMPPPGGVN